MGFVIPMLIGMVGSLVSFVATLFFSPETKGKAMVADPTLVTLEECHWTGRGFRFRRGLTGTGMRLGGQAAGAARGAARDGQHNKPG